MEPSNEEARIQKVKSWSPVWILPIIMALIGAWILFYHYSYQGPGVILVIANAGGIEGGKTTIKSHSVDVDIVKSAILADDLTRIEIKARLNSGMEESLYKDTAFWVMKPQIGREGISGLGILLSGVYIELQPGVKGSKMDKYGLLGSSPLASPDAKDIRVSLDSKRAGQLSPGDPMPFRSCRAGSVEASTFDTQKHNINCQLFINAPYNRLMTSSIRF